DSQRRSGARASRGPGRRHHGAAGELNASQEASEASEEATEAPGKAASVSEEAAEASGKAAGRPRNELGAEIFQSLEDFGAQLGQPGVMSQDIGDSSTSGHR